MNLREIAEKVIKSARVFVAVQYWDEEANEIKVSKFQDPSIDEIEAAVADAYDQDAKVETKAVASSKAGRRETFYDIDVVDPIDSSDARAFAADIQSSFEEFYDEIVTIDLEQHDRKAMVR